MPPKKADPKKMMTAKGRGGGGREPPQEGSEAAGATSVASKLNAEYNSSLKNAYERILAHPKFVGITSKLGPEGRDFDQKLYEKDIGERGFHRFDGNAFMVALQLHGGVPVSRK